MIDENRFIGIDDDGFIIIKARPKNDWSEVERIPKGQPGGGQWTDGNPLGLSLDEIDSLKPLADPEREKERQRIRKKQFEQNIAEAERFHQMQKQAATEKREDDLPGTKEERDAIKWYTDNGISNINYDVINRYLITGESPTITGLKQEGKKDVMSKVWPEEEIKERIKLIDSLLSKLEEPMQRHVKWDGTSTFYKKTTLVERGMSVYEEKVFNFYKGLKVGDELLQKSYLSTTPKGWEGSAGSDPLDDDGYWIAGHFMGRSRINYNTGKIEKSYGSIHLVIETNSGVNISKYSISKHESEILIPRGKKFKVTSIEFKDSKDGELRKDWGKLLTIKLTEL